MWSYVQIDYTEIFDSNTYIEKYPEEGFQMGLSIWSWKLLFFGDYFGRFVWEISLLFIIKGFEGFKYM